MTAHSIQAVLQRWGVRAALQPLHFLIRANLTPDLLHPKYRAKNAGRADPTGHCVAAAGAFWWLAGGPKRGWRFRRITRKTWRRGPHYFLEHTSGVLVDPTADQFRERVPYERAVGGAPPTRGAPITVAARELVRRVLATKRGKTASYRAIKWSLKQLQRGS
jgi:hypothetical protein